MLLALLLQRAPQRRPTVAPAAPAHQQTHNEAVAALGRLEPAGDTRLLAAPITDPAEIRQRLVEQVTGTVRWRESVAYMAEQGVATFYEIGAGKVLSGLVARIAPGATGISVGAPADIAAFKTARQG
jgi:[acyl-carrier-protein] S-malonyltransferase